MIEILDGGPIQWPLCLKGLKFEQCDGLNCLPVTIFDNLPHNRKMSNKICFKILHILSEFHNNQTINDEFSPKEKNDLVFRTWSESAIRTL